MRPPATRREFLGQASQSAAVLCAATALGGAHLFADEKPATVRLGIVGCGGIMTHHVTGLVNRREAVSLAWLCDVDPAQIAQMDARVTREFQAAPPKRTHLFEDVIEDRDVDAVIIATPHHWHAPMALRAMQAGKDVYIEKPISHAFNEGPLIVAAAQKYGRVVQQGSQMRSSPVTEKAGQLLRQGIIGEVKVARAWTAETRKVAKPLPDGTPPAGVDYDRWLGPAPERPFNPHRFHRTWRMFRDYGNGEIGDDGIHDLDMAAWGLGVETLPAQITARGSRMLLDGHASEYPDNMHVTYQYPDGRLLIPPRNSDVALEPVLGVEYRDVKLLNRKIFEAGREDLMHVAGAAHGDSILPFLGGHATAKLECRVDRNGSRGADAVERGERSHRLSG